MRTTTTTISTTYMDTTILTLTEIATIMSLGGFKSFTLLYRGTKDGFFNFNQECNSKKVIFQISTVWMSIIYIAKL